MNHFEAELEIIFFTHFTFSQLNPDLNNNYRRFLEVQVLVPNRQAPHLWVAQLPSELPLGHHVAMNVLGPI